jgi:hypothetical protein
MEESSCWDEGQPIAVAPSAAWSGEVTRWLAPAAQ